MATPDLPAYFERIRYSGSPAPDVATLRALHLAHATHIPFENLDILLGQPVSLDLERVQGKLVTQQRGGYCFEHNTLFAAVLRALGFSVTPLAARVRQRQTRRMPRTHMCLLVEAEGSGWMADVGFGGDGLLFPVAMTGEIAQQYLWQYRIVEESEGLYVMQSACGRNWNDLYAFTLEPQDNADFEMANYYVSTHPQSRFVRTLTVQLLSPERRKILRNRELIIDDGCDVQACMIHGNEGLVDVLSKQFGLNFPSGTVFGFDENAE